MRLEDGYVGMGKLATRRDDLMAAYCSSLSVHYASQTPSWVCDIALPNLTRYRQGLHRARVGHVYSSRVYGVGVREHEEYLARLKMSVCALHETPMMVQLVSCIAWHVINLQGANDDIARFWYYRRVSAKHNISSQVSHPFSLPQETSFVHNSPHPRKQTARSTLQSQAPSLLTTHAHTPVLLRGPRLIRSMTQLCVSPMTSASPTNPMTMPAKYQVNWSCC